ncbi:hypothetical protein J1782_24110 [Rahnella sp. BCC 1045]|uniref:hypothetical protein n=1 Tax=Rahnella sp. BCC 1045 TaxID=2816251 RepID=UPI001C274C73|nr:hypothetical protein [Rahnella sp. BCC 1045]MBU9822981.1 hypothetical protein [Rahnella sp. BCC 1045]
MQYLETKLNGINRRIAEANEIVKKRHRSVQRAERNLEHAQNEAYSLFCERDSILIESWGNKPNWPSIFDSDDNETHVMREYKLAWIEQAGLNLNGGYNINTKQRGFAISFSSNSPTELQQKIQLVKFTLEYLKSDERDEKVMSVFNLGSEDCAWSFFSNRSTGKFGLAKERWGHRVSQTDFDSLHDCLNHIQSLSDTDIIPENTHLSMPAMKGETQS